MPADTYPFPTISCSHCQETGFDADEINDGICLACEDETVCCGGCGVRIDFDEAVEMADGYCCDDCAVEAEPAPATSTHGTLWAYRRSVVG